MDEQLVTIGGELKALGDGKVGGYLVRFGDAETPDATGDYFTADTDFGIVDRAIGWVHHRQPMESPKTGQKARYTQRLRNPVKLVKDDIGILAEVMLDLRDTYENMFYKAADAGKLGWSSGTAPHLVEREYQDNGTAWIKQWPLGDDASLTPAPVEPRTRVVSLKSYMELSEPYVKALLPQVDAGSDTADATDGAAEPPTTNTKGAQTPTGEYEMTPEEIQAMIAQASETAAAAAVKAYEAKLAAEPPVNPMEFDAGGNTKSQPATTKAKPELFKNLGEQLIAVKNAALNYSYDRRLDATKAILGGNETVASEGGFLVATEQDSGLDKKVWDSGVFAGRAMQRTISAGSNSADFYGLSENSRADGSRYGGITGYRVAEAATITASGPQKFYRYTLKPKKYAAVAYLTDEVLNDARLLEQELSAGIVGELAFMIDDDMFRGAGVAGCYGILNHPCLVTASKEAGQAADTVVWKNILKMWVRRYARGSYVWFINQEVEEQLDQLYQAVGTAGIPPNFVTYDQQGAMRIKGAPVVVNEFSSGVGDLGDIVLADWSQYKVATIGGVQAASSMHVQFLTDQMAYRFIRRVDGQPTWQSDLTPYKGTNTQSPFITLEAR